MVTRRKFTVEFKRQLVEEVKSGIMSRAQACRQHGIADSVMANWTDKYEHGKLNNEPSEIGALENRIAELERMVGQLTMENGLLKKARELYQKRLSEGLSRSTDKGASNGGARR